MKKSLLIALFAAMPLMAQDCPQKPECAPKKPCCMKMHRGHRPQLTEEQKAEMKAKFMEKFDTDKDGQISDAEKAAIKAQFEAKQAEMKAKFEAKKAEMKAKFMEKFDTNKDGQLSDEEKAAAKAEFKKNAPKFRKHGRHGKRCGKCCGKKAQRPQLTEEQKAEMKAKFEARKAERKAKFMEKFDTDKDGKISDAEKEAIKAEFKKNAPKFRKHGRHGKRCCNKCAK